MQTFLKGLGLRRRLLTATGAGFMYERIEELERRCFIAESAVKAGVGLPDQLRLLQSEMTHFSGLQSADRLIELDFPVVPRVRYGWEAPPPSRPIEKSRIRGF